MLPFYPNLSHCLHLNYVMLRLRFSKLMSKAFCVYVLAWVNSIYIHGIRMRFSCCAVTLQLLIAGYSHCLYHLRIIFFFVSVAKCVFFLWFFFINVCNICVNDFCDDWWIEEGGCGLARVGMGWRGRVWVDEGGCRLAREGVGWRGRVWVGEGGCGGLFGRGGGWVVAAFVYVLVTYLSCLMKNMPVRVWCRLDTK